MGIRGYSSTLALALLLPGMAAALGFGDITAHSGFNAPLNAEVGITATADERVGLSVALASREAFASNGLDYPAYLAGASVELAQSADGRDILRVQTREPVTEPIVTLLVEISYARGRQQREFTVFLDPPSVAGQAVVAPVSAPVASAPPRSVPAAAVAPASSATAATEAAARYRVQRGDTLSQIVARQLPAADRARALVSVFRANQASFDGNMNELRAGAELILPTESELAAVSSVEAATEVARQFRGWSGGSAAGRLRLVPPSDSAAVDAGSGSAGASGPAADSVANSALKGQVQDLQKQLADTKRALEVTSAQLKQLQDRAAARPVAPAPNPVPAATPAPTPAETPASPSAATNTPPATAPEPAVTAPSAPAAEAPPASSPSLVDWLLGQPLLLGAAAVLLAALGAVLIMRNRRAAAEPPEADRFDTTTSFERSAAVAQTLPARELPEEVSEAIEVSESTAATPRPVIEVADDTLGDTSSVLATLASSGNQPVLVPVTSDVDAPESGSTSTTTDIDHGDPLAEADFHMAYGLYDQAADLVKQAIVADPARRDLQLKLLEVYFVWGNKDEFLQLARSLAASRNPADDSEWEKIVIMGRQIAADDPLFSVSPGAGAGGRAEVDLNLEGGQNRVDFNIMGEPTIAAADGDEIDLDFGDIGDVLPDTAEAPKPKLDSSVDFMLDPSLRGDDSGESSAERTADTQQMLQPPRGQFPDLLDDSGDTRMDLSTAQMPGMVTEDAGTIRQKLGGQAARQGLPLTGAEATAELALDDLGLDLGTIEVPAAPKSEAVSDTGVDLMLDIGTGTLDVSNSSLGGEWSMTNESTALTEAFDSAATAATPVLTMPDAPDSQTSDSMRLDADPPTMSEVGTKLDLARAYMDMGDPEGARSILDEVLAEGSGSQKQEARRLLESLPG